MRTFVVTALLIALVLVGQQWAVKSTEAAGPAATAEVIAVAPAPGTAAARALTSWYAGS